METNFNCSNAVFKKFNDSIKLELEKIENKLNEELLNKYIKASNIDFKEESGVCKYVRVLYPQGKIVINLGIDRNGEAVCLNDVRVWDIIPTTKYRLKFIAKIECIIEVEAFDEFDACEKVIDAYDRGDKWLEDEIEGMGKLDELINVKTNDDILYNWNIKRNSNN